MSLSKDSKKRLIVALTDETIGKEVAAAIDNASNGNLVFNLHPANPHSVLKKEQLIIMNIDNQVGTLPSATGSGRVISFLAQAPSNVLNIYPQAADQIDALSAGEQFQVWIASPSVKFVDVSMGKWVSL